jgi:ketosteroid isomerase-like protein
MPAEGPGSPFWQPSTNLLAPNRSTARSATVDAGLDPGTRSVDLIRQAYEALGRGDEEPLLSLVDDHVEWRGVAHGFRRRRALCRGRVEVRDALVAIIAEAALPEADWRTVDDVVRVGDRAIVTFSSATPVGTTIEMAHILSILDDRVVEIEDDARPARAHRRCHEGTRAARAIASSLRDLPSCVCRGRP